MKKYSELSDREKVEFLESILDSVNDLVLVKGENSRLLWANKSFCEIYGMSPAELQGLLDAPHSNPDHTLQYVQDDKFVFDNAKTLNILSEPITYHDGTVRHFHTIKSPILNDEKEVVMSVGVSRLINDASKVSKLEKAHWAASQTAEQLNQFVEALPACLAVIDV